MLKNLRRINNHYCCYYVRLGRDGSKITRLNFPRACFIQNEFFHSKSAQNHLGLSFQPNRDNVRYKSKGQYKKSSYADSDDEFSDDEVNFKDGEIDDDGGRMRRIQSKGLRLDQVLKVGLGLTKRRIEEGFFAKRVKVNGQNPLKKSTEIVAGDEIEFYSESNDGTSSAVSKLVIKKIEFLPGIENFYFVYVSVHKD